MSDRLREHLRDHLTDGYWHDGCPYCRRRRIKGGTGVEVPASSVRAADTGREAQ